MDPTSPKPLAAFDEASQALHTRGPQLTGIYGPMLQAVEAKLPILQQGFELLNLHNARNNSIRLAPSNPLPSEILTVIFILVIDDAQADYARNPCRAKGRNTTASFISSVSLRWREVALSIPALWSQPVVYLTRQPDILAPWLSRSAGLPLDVCLRNRYGHDGLVVDRVFDQLAPHIHRLTSLRMEQDNNLCIRALESCAKFRVPHGGLTSLTMCNPYSGFEGAMLRLDSSIKQYITNLLEPLKVLHLQGIDIRGWPLSSFHDLVDLALDLHQDDDYPIYKKLAEMLRANLGLRSLKLSGIDTRYTAPHGIAKIALDHLEILSLRCLPQHVISWLLTTIVPRAEGMSLGVLGMWEQGGDVGLDLPFDSPERIKALYISTTIRQQMNLNLTALLTNLLCLETLGLKNLELNVPDSIVAHQPSLHTLDMMNCSVPSESHLVDTLVRHSVSRFRMLKITNGPSAAELRERIHGLEISEGDAGFLDDMISFPF